MQKKIILVFTLASLCFLMSSLVTPLPGPPGGDLAPYINGVFSEEIPGEGGSWAVEEPFPQLQIPSPLRIMPYPGTVEHLVLSKKGAIYRVSFETKEQEELLDFSDRTFHLGEPGATGMAVHPKFSNPTLPEHKDVFVFYRTKPDVLDWEERGFNRLSKFSWIESEGRWDSQSEEILINQYDRCSWHMGGGMFFGPDGFLYLALGDEGKLEMQEESNQRLDGGMFGGLIRIDIDKDPTRSHPIRRQPIAFDPEPDGWGETFTQGYFIPNDNPWQSPGGEGLEEFAAIGLRSPYSTHLDTVSNTIWSLDVGSDKKEEFNHIEIGDNLQWPFMEGTLESDVHPRPENVIGSDKGPIYEYDRSVGNAVVMGGVYRGEKFLSLRGEYLHGDYTQQRVMALKFDSDDEEPTQRILVPDVRNFGFELPEKGGMTGVHVMENGDVLITMINEDSFEPGHFFRLVQKDVLPDPPKMLSQLGVFRNLENLEPISSIIPYTVNAPFWSDRTIKKRWMAIPNLESTKRIDFQRNREWEFPEGTVFIKHFELPTTMDDQGPTIRLETRFFVIGKDGLGYGLTYKWNEEGTDAELLRIGDVEHFDITENGQVVMSQQWDYPSRTQCLTCHTNNSGYVLGVNTHQLNCDMVYVNTGNEMNQLVYLSRCGLLDTEITEPTALPKAYHIEDNSVDLELRIRSYLASNCSSCHQEGGVPDVDMDLRFGNSRDLQSIIFEKTKSVNSDPEGYLVEPGNHADSELWIRDASTEENQMPPLSRNLVDQIYVDSLAKWIDGLSLDLNNKKIWTYPNPASEYVEIQMSHGWELPIRYSIYDLQGRRIESGSFSERSQHIKLNHYEKGVYFIVIEAGDESITQKILKI